MLRTEDGGYLWQTCAIPPGAEKLDFRGVQAFDENTAIVMSSGPGDQSRLYKTTDGCQTWKLLFTNPGQRWLLGRDTVTRPRSNLKSQAIQSTHVLVSEKTGHVTPVWRLNQGDDPDSRSSDHFFELPADPKEGDFAASNSTLVIGTVRASRFSLEVLMARHANPRPLVCPPRDR